MNSLVSSNLINDKLDSKHFQITSKDLLHKCLPEDQDLGPQGLLGGSAHWVDNTASGKLLTGVWIQTHWTFISEETGRWTKALTPTLYIISQVQQAAPLLELYI